MKQYITEFNSLSEDDRMILICFFLFCIAVITGLTIMWESFIRRRRERIRKAKLRAQLSPISRAP